MNSARNWAKAVVRWGLALDPNGNPHVNSPDACSGCRGIVSIDQGSGNVTYNSDYYGLGQFSKFVQPGASPTNGGFTYIVNLHSGLALDDTNGSTSNGTLVQQWAQTNGDANQEWSLVPAGNGHDYIVNLHSGLALDDTNGSTSNGTQMQLWTQSNGNANQEWSLMPV